MLTGMLELFRFEKIAELFPIFRTDEQEQQLFIIPKNYPPIISPTKFPKIHKIGTAIRLYARDDALITTYMAETERLLD